MPLLCHPFCPGPCNPPRTLLHSQWSWKYSSHWALGPRSPPQLPLLPPGAPRQVLPVLRLSPTSNSISGWGHLGWPGSCFLSPPHLPTGHKISLSPQIPQVFYRVTPISSSGTEKAPSVQAPRARLLPSHFTDGEAEAPGKATMYQTGHLVSAEPRKGWGRTRCRVHRRPSLQGLPWLPMSHCPPLSPPFSSCAGDGVRHPSTRLQGHPLPESWQGVEELGSKSSRLCGSRSPPPPFITGTWLVGP